MKLTTFQICEMRTKIFNEAINKDDEASKKYLELFDGLDWATIDEYDNENWGFPMTFKCPDCGRLLPEKGTSHICIEALRWILWKKLIYLLILVYAF